MRKEINQTNRREWIRNRYANSLKVHYRNAGNSMKSLKLHTLDALYARHSFGNQKS